MTIYSSPVYHRCKGVETSQVLITPEKSDRMGPSPIVKFEVSTVEI